MKAVINFLAGALMAAIWLGAAYIALFHLSDAGGVISWVS